MTVWLDRLMHERALRDASSVVDHGIRQGGLIHGGRHALVDMPSWMHFRGADLSAEDSQDPPKQTPHELIKGACCNDEAIKAGKTIVELQDELKKVVEKLLDKVKPEDIDKVVNGKDDAGLKKTIKDALNALAKETLEDAKKKIKDGLPDKWLLPIKPCPEPCPKPGKCEGHGAYATTIDLGTKAVKDPIKKAVAELAKELAGAALAGVVAEFIESLWAANPFKAKLNIRAEAHIEYDCNDDVFIASMRVFIGMQFAIEVSAGLTLKDKWLKALAEKLFGTSELKYDLQMRVGVGIDASVDLTTGATNGTIIAGDGGVDDKFNPGPLTWKSGFNGKLANHLADPPINWPDEHRVTKASLFQEPLEGLDWFKNAAEKKAEGQKDKK